MSNEKWWLNFLDRSLLEDPELNRYISNLTQIKHEQQKSQIKQQESQLKQYSNENNTPNLSNGQNNKKINGLKNLRKFLNGKQSNENNVGDQLLSTQIEVNSYDENIRPKRLLNSSKSKSHLDTNGAQLISENLSDQFLLSDFKYDIDAEKRKNEKLNFYEKNDLNYIDNSGGHNNNNNNYTNLHRVDDINSKFYLDLNFSKDNCKEETLDVPKINHLNNYKNTLEQFSQMSKATPSVVPKRGMNYQNNEHIPNRYLNTSIETPI